MIGEKALVFDIKGSLAHFRAFYTNSSSISYGFPPRTAVIGMISAILGYEKDSYYNVFSPENLRISVSVLHPVRKYIQSINYVRTKPDQDNFNKFVNTVQAYLEQKINTYPVSVELLIPEKEVIAYRIYIYFKNEEIYKNLKRYLENRKSFYPVYLGISEFLADIEFIGEFELKIPDESKGVKSIIPQELFDSIDFSKPVSLIVEKMPVHFTLENGLRKLLSVKKYIYEKNCKEVSVLDYKNVYCINGENIVWME
ncbi:type I-B CRISPR-associated protein Cas5b [Desulfurobacterium sp.]